MKLRGSRTFRDYTNLALRLLGPEALIETEPWHTLFLTAPSLSIRGGTDEIQRNIIGERILGADALTATEPWHTLFLTAPSLSIRGGTDEIQRNIVGEHVLGLPPEPRVDRDLPYDQLPRPGRRDA